MEARTIGQLVLGFGGKLVALGFALYLTSTVIHLIAHAFAAVRAGMGAQ
jgi:hypothetical protein